MEELKTHKKKVEAAKDAGVKHHLTHKAVDHEDHEPKKSTPRLGQKVQYAAYAAVSTTERLITGLSNMYESIFVGHQERKLDFNKEKGLESFNKGDYKSAVSFLKSYLEEGNSSDAQMVYLLALSYVNLEQYEEAIEYFKKAHELDNNDLEITVEMAHCLLNLEDYSEAIGCFKQAIDKVPGEADHYYNLGSCYEKTGQVEEAKSMYKKAIDLAPRQGVYYQALGFVYENSGNHKDAIVCFKKAMDLDRKQRTAGGGLQQRRKLNNTTPGANRDCAGIVSVHEE